MGVPFCLLYGSLDEPGQLTFLEDAVERFSILHWNRRQQFECNSPCGKQVVALY